MKMTEPELLAVLNAESSQARAWADETAQERSKGVRAYMRFPYGTEQAGRSQVIASDVFDTVEGMLPELIEVFVASDKAVVFDPTTAEDEEGAEQATRACNHVFYKQNNGFHLLYTACKDGLHRRVGALKWYWDERKTPEWVTRKAVDELQLAAWLIANPDAEVVSREEYEPTEEETQQAAMTGQPLAPMVTVRIKTVKKRGIVKLCAIPPWELKVSRMHNSPLLSECPYVSHTCQVTLSEIRQMGYRVTAEDVKAAETDERGSEDEDYSGSMRDRHRTMYNDAPEDESLLRGWLHEEYVLVDFDGDGIAERRKVLRLGQKVLENVEFSHVPIAAWSPYLLTHQFEGLSAADLAEDFQRIRTDIWRAQLDSLEFANNQETVVLTDSNGNPKANIDDLLHRRPMGILREQMAGAIRPYNEHWKGIEAMPMLEALEQAKQARTGHIPTIEGLDADALQKSATQVSKESNQRQKRMKLMARIMGECLVAPTMRGIFKTLTDYCMEPLSFKLSGQYVAYDPQEWRDGYNMTINVGIGTGDQLQQGIMLNQIAGAQFALLQSPMGYIVSPQNIYAVQARIAENAGFKNANEFFTDPKTVQPPPPQPDPKMLIEQAKLQADAQRFQAESQMDAQKFQAEAQMSMQVEATKQEMQARQRQLELEQQAQLKALEAEYAERARIDQMALDKYKADLDAQVKLTIADKPAADVSTLREQLQALSDMAAATPELIRDDTEQVVAVRKGAKTYQVARDEMGRPSGLMEIAEQVAENG
jgi:hypothetical protein